MTRVSSLRSRLFVLAAVLALCVGCGSRRPTPTPKPEPPPTATLAASVVDDRTGQAVEGARLDVQWTETEDDGHTNADGYVGINGNPLHVEFVVQVVADGYHLWEAVVSLTGNLQLDVRLTPAGGGVVGSAPWPGRLALGSGGRGFVDGDGQYQLPLCAHFGEAFSKWTRDAAQIDAQNGVVKSAGFDCIRFWDTLGYYDVVWRNKEVMPWRFHNRSGTWIDATPDYYDRLEQFLGTLKRIGLTTHHSRGDLVSSTLFQVVDHAGHVAHLYDRVGWDVLALAEGNNEDWQNGGFGPSGLRQIVAPFRASGALTALSAPPDAAEETEALRLYASDIFYVHGQRTGGYAAILRHIFSIARHGANELPWSGWQGEPAGPGNGVSVGQVNDREALALMAAQSFIGRQAWVYMSGCGVFYTCPLESQPGFWAVPRIRDAMEAFGRDLMTWRLSHRSASDAALRSDAALEAGDERVDQTIAPDGRVAATVYGNTGRQSVQNVTGSPLSCDVIGVADDEQLTHATVTVVPGGWIPLSYRVGRLLLCTPVH